ncbi:MGMT family protein [Legionella maioricensis]|uniref:MGMT family protein n=1 Tax=Legionella maioricensis TaxID=2896528 RepID=A0A9X2ICP2_9GAMM|nr:MGMT family protein [Legionella maioricensis]MCL9685640.1 MGMT family protein [Legionella maioricensis]MCL9689049.1 MGMT family protein [Legionella maioricensis]
MSDALTEFSNKIMKLIKAIPKGKVATYGLIAELAGSPHGARQVGWFLHSSTKKYNLPWHRVIKSGGKLSFPEQSTAYLRQKELLEKEGIVFLNGRIDLKIYLWVQKCN